jgi:putative phosphoribosyl transferase
LKQTVVSSVIIPLDVGRLDGILSVPEDASGLVLFLHGSSSSDQKPGNELIATALQKSGIATLLFDPLTPVEDSRQGNRFNVDLLADRLELATNWITEQSDLPDRAIGYFGAGTGAAAALRSAAHLDKRVKAVVLRGGRPDLAGTQALSALKAPTLLLVGGRDTSAIALNREALGKMQCEKRMHVIPGATNRFEQPGTLEQAASEATAWFSRYFGD